MPPKHISIPQSNNHHLWMCLSCPDFLDHKAMIRWTFTSRDTRFVITPEGYVNSLDTGELSFELVNMYFLSSIFNQINVIFSFLQESVKIQ